MTPRKPFVVSLIAALAALILYAPILRIPLIYDTLLHIRIAEDLNLLNVWMPTEAFGFYRPMTFVPVILTRQIFGHFPTWFFNGMSWLQHAFNAGLLVVLVYRLSKNQRQALIAGLLFVAFPFSYQALGVYGHNVHPAIVGLMLIGLQLFLNLEWGLNANDVEVTRRDGRARDYVALFVVLALGFLTHESFVLFGPFCVLLTVYSLEAGSIWSMVQQWRRFVPAAILTLIGLAYIIIYQFLPISRAPQSDTLATAVEPKLLYLLQALTHPISWFGHQLPNVAARTLVVIALVILCVLTVVCLRIHWKMLLIGWGWWLAASVLIAVPLPTGYLINGPRLLYLSSVGIVLIWSTVLTTRSRERSWSSVVYGLQLATTAFILIVSVQFVRIRLNDYAKLTAGIATLNDEANRDGGVLLVNLPQWIAPERNTYPVGAEFVQQLGFYLFAEEWVNHNLQLSLPTRAIKIDELLTQTAYGYDVHEQHVVDTIDAAWQTGGSDVFVTRYLEGGPMMEKFGRFQPKSSAPFSATIDPYTIHAPSARHCNDVITVTSEWALLDNAQSSPNITLFVQLLDENGVLIAQNDRPPLGIRPDRINLSANYAIQDQRTLTFENGTPTTVLIGVYDFTTGERFPAQDADALPLPDNALRIPVEPCP